jgi:hypothetical protein
MTTPTHPLAPRDLVALALVATAFAIWEGFQPWPSLAAHLSIPLAVLAVLGLAILSSRHRPHLVTTREWLQHGRDGITHPSLHTLSLAGWLVLSATIAGWDLNSFLRRQRNLPTLSRLIGALTHEPIGRMFFVLVWLALGVYFALGNKRPRTESHR